MKVCVSKTYAPIPTRCLDYAAVDYDTYGGEDGDVVGYGATEQEAVLNLIYNTDALWPEKPSFELCSEVNPDLWQAYCHLMGRLNAPSAVWTEHDVVVHIDLLADQILKDKTNV